MSLKTIKSEYAKKLNKIVRTDRHNEILVRNSGIKVIILCVISFMLLFSKRVHNINNVMIKTLILITPPNIIITYMVTLNQSNLLKEEDVNAINDVRNVLESESDDVVIKGGKENYSITAGITHENLELYVDESDYMQNNQMYLKVKGLDDIRYNVQTLEELKENEHKKVNIKEEITVKCKNNWPVETSSVKSFI